MLEHDQLIAIIQSHRRNALGYEDGDLSNDRAKAMDHYHGRPYGDEVEGRSQVVSRDLSETVDWIMPEILNVFIKSGNMAEFRPVGPEDEQLAQQESDYTNHVIMQENEGFILLHDAFKDALLLKNGYWKHYCDESEKVTEEEYEGLSEDELAILIGAAPNAEDENGTPHYARNDDEELKIIGQNVRSEIINGQEIPIYDVKLEIKRKEKRIIVEAVPTEEVRVSKKCRGSLQNSPFTEHVTRKTRTDLLEMGMDEDFVNELPGINEDENDSEVRARDSSDDESDTADGVSYDRSMDEIEYCEAYIRIDYDGDGRAELRKIVTVANRIPPGDEWNEVIEAVPMTGVVPKRVPHRHVGESLDDEISDLQQIKTVLTRQMLDNIYLTNNQEKIVNQRVHLPDMMQSLPGGIKRVKDDLPVTGAVEYIMTPSILAQILPAIDYIDAVKANRTGVTESNTGMDPDVIKQSTEGAFMEAVRQGSRKIEMIARMLAETGVKELVKQVHGLLIRHGDKQKVVKLRGQYVTVNPSEWRERNNLVVKVGIGTGTEEDKRTGLMILGQAQEKAAQLGLVGPRQGFQMFKDLAATLGRENPEKYVMDPESEEYAQFQQMQAQNQGSNPLAEAEQIKGQFAIQSAQMKAQFDAQVKQMQEQHKSEMELMRMQAQMIKDDRDRQSREAVEIMKAEVQAFLSGMKLDMGKPGIGAELNAT